MANIPIELPVKASEAASLADLIFQQLEGKPLTDNERIRLSSRAAALELTSITPFWGSLQQDPVHSTMYYLAVAGDYNGVRTPLLLRMGLASAPASGIFPKAMLIGRMRPGGGREVVVNAIPFSPNDRASIRTFVEQVDRAFIPRPHGIQPSITLINADPEDAFDSFRAIHRQTGLNVASLQVESIEVALWAAIRSGWRDGYSAGIRIESPSLDAARDAVHNNILNCRFSFDVSAFPSTKTDDDSWLYDEFSRPFVIGGETWNFDEKAVRYLAARYSPSLQAQQELYDFVRREKAAAGLGRSFDFELLLDTSAPEELIFCLHYFKSNGRPVQFVNLPLPAEGLELIAAIVRHFNAALSVAASPDDTPELLAKLGQATSGRFNYGVHRAADIAPAFQQLRG